MLFIYLQLKFTEIKIFIALPKFSPLEIEAKNSYIKKEQSTEFLKMARLFLTLVIVITSIWGAIPIRQDWLTTLTDLLVKMLW